MKQYNTYKPSGIEWLGEIPEHWEVKRIKNICDYISRGITPNYVEYSSCKVINQGTFSKGFFDLENAKYTTNIDKRALVKDNDILIASTGGGVLGKTFFIDKIEDLFYADSHVTTIRVDKKQLISKYLYYFLSINYELINGLLAKGSTNQTELQKDQLLNFHWSVPSLSEQTAIANYLDTKTAAIERKIELLTAKVDKYKALRRSLINETVCRGLNPNAPLKDSGIEWIGMIPAHWEIKRMKSLGEIETSSVDKKTLDNEALIKLVNYTDIYGNTNKEIWNNDNYMIVSANEKQLKSKKLRTGDVLFTPSSETIEDIGVSAVVMEDLNNTLYSYHILRFKFYEILDLKFKKYMLNNDFVQYYFSKSASGTTRKILGLNIFWNLHVILPPLAEQIEIGQYLDEKTTQIDTILTNIGEQINKLTQLRKTLINDVVTGKIKVTD